MSLSVWQRMTVYLVAQERRLQNAAWLREETSLTKIPEKIPAATQEKRMCLHLEVRGQGSQWCQAKLCKKCNLRLTYLPTALALEAATHRQSRSQQRKQPMTRSQAREKVQEKEVSGEARSSGDHSTQRIEELLSLSAEANITTQGIVERLANHTEELSRMIASVAARQPGSSRTEWYDVSMSGSDTDQ